MIEWKEDTNTEGFISWDLYIDGKNLGYTYQDTEDSLPLFLIYLPTADLDEAIEIGEYKSFEDIKRDIEIAFGE